jgi:hypothetical protein
LYVEQVLAPSLHAGQIVIMDPATGTQKRTGQNGHRDERLSTSFLDLAIHPTFLPLKRRFPSSKQPYAAQEPEPERLWKKPLAKHYSPSPLKMRRGGFSIVGIFFLDKKRRVNMAQTFSTPLSDDSAGIMQYHSTN